MRLSWLPHIGAAVILAVAAMILLDPEKTAYRAPLVIGLAVLTIAVAYVKMVVDELRKDPNEGQAQAIILGKLPGWQNFPRELREQIEKEEDDRWRAERRGT